MATICLEKVTSTKTKFQVVIAEQIELYFLVWSVCGQVQSMLDFEKMRQELWWSSSLRAGYEWYIRDSLRDCANQWRGYLI